MNSTHLKLSPPSGLTQDLRLVNTIEDLEVYAKGSDSTNSTKAIALGGITLYYPEKYHLILSWSGTSYYARR